MSGNPALAEIDYFISSTKSGALCVYGEWGCGKTHAWNERLSFAKSHNTIDLEKYSYVSLFGIGSLSDLRYTIFENTQPKNMIGRPISLETYNENLSGFSQIAGKKSLRFLSNVSMFGIKDLAAGAHAIASLSVANTMICIDDFERKPDSLALDSVFGLISYLCEQKNCKVVLLLNLDILFSEAEKFKEHPEKVFSRIIKFSPYANRICDIALGSSKGIHVDIIRDICLKLEIKNIRIIEKILANSQQIDFIFKKIDPEIIKRIVKSLAVFTNGVYGNGATIDFLTKKWETTRFNASKLDELTSIEINWVRLLSNISYGSVEVFENLILEGVKNGYFIVGALEEFALKLNEEHVRLEKVQSFDEIWQKLHGSLDNNEDEFIENIYNSFNESVPYVSVGNLNTAIGIIREFGKDSLADKMIEKYFGQLDKLNVIDISFLHNESSDDSFRMALLNWSQTRQKGVSLQKVVEKIANEDKWNSDDLQVLLQSTPEQIYDILYRSENMKPRNAVINLMKLEDISGHEHIIRVEICRKVKIALKKLYSMSRMNRLRLKYWLGVKSFDLNSDVVTEEASRSPHI